MHIPERLVRLTASHSPSWDAVLPSDCRRYLPLLDGLCGRVWRPGLVFLREGAGMRGREDGVVKRLQSTGVEYEGGADTAEGSGRRLLPERWLGDKRMRLLRL